MLYLRTAKLKFSNNHNILKIGLVLAAQPKYSETFFINKIHGLVNDGHELVLFLDSPGEFNYNNVEVVQMTPIDGNKFSLIIKSFLLLILIGIKHPKKVRRLNRLDKFDNVGLKRRLKNIIRNSVFFAYDLDWLHFGFGMLVMNRENLAEAIGAKMAVSFRGADLYLSPLKHINCYNRLVQKRVKYHVISEEMKKTLIEEYSVSDNDISVIQPAIDTSFFVTDVQGSMGTPLKMTTIARLHWKKGLVYTLEALAKLKENGVVFNYDIIGEGDELERLKFAAHQLNLTKEVNFVGKCTPNEIKNKLNSTDIYLQYSIQEGFCNSVLEAQAMGLLTVVSNAEGLAENVIHNQTGFVVPKRQPETLFEHLLKIISMPLKEQHKIRTNAVTRVSKEFSLSRQRLKFFEFYSNRDR